MYDLDVILDEVRDKYYVSNVLPRPTISWSDECWTGFYGKYTLFDNHIEISRILNTDEIPYEALASVVYHENLHQDFAEHNRQFNLRANKFPGYKKYSPILNAYASKISATLEYKTVLANYAKGYDRITYIVLPYLENFNEAFTFYNGNIYVDFSANVLVSEDCFAIFLVDNGAKYHIVAWANGVKILEKKTIVKQEALGGYDFQYKALAPRNNFRILFDTTCNYGIDKNSFTNQMQKEMFGIFDAETSDIEYDLNYINTYCEGFLDLGLDTNCIYTAAPYCIDKYSELEKIAIAKTGFNGLWASNALCKMDINFRSLYLKAHSLRQIGMIDLAYEVMKQSYGLSNGEDYVVEEMIITCALVNDFKLGNQIIKELSMINNENPHIDKCIQFLTKGN
ncbi:MAG: hypothetical protein RR710_07855 [Oscillospiraceae bacterium]